MINFLLLVTLDGSFNFERKIEEAGCSIALFNGERKFGNEIMDFIGNYLTGDMFFVEKGSGAFKNSEKIKCRNTKKLRGSVIGIDFDYENPEERNKL